MMQTLPKKLLTHPVAHRALHDVSQGRAENSAAAVQAAIDANYCIEIDVQISADKKPVVFHDYDLGRLTDSRGAVNKRAARTLQGIPLIGGGGAGMPTLASVLQQVAGQVPLLIEIKDQDGALGLDIGVLEAEVAQAINEYTGPVAVMSFNPNSVAAMQTLAPNVPRGLVTEDFGKADWNLPEGRASALTHIPDYDRVGACFISHNRSDLDHPRVAELKAQGAGILTWTIKSEEQEQAARKIADNITFEGYLPNARP